jgi:putative transposon-encoded protein
MLNDTQIPANRVAITEPNTSLFSRPWFRFFSNLYEYIGLADGVVPVSSGGTGITTYAAGDLLYAPTANTLAKLHAPGIASPSYLGTDGTNMPQWIDVAYGSFDARTTQTGVANTPIAVTFDTSDYHNLVDLGSPASRIYFTNAGVYNVQISVQLQNADTTSDDDVTIWFKLVGTNVGNSASTVTIPKKHGGLSGSIIIAMNIYQAVTAGQYIELYWLSRTGTTQIFTIPATTTPLVPQSPGVIITMNQII